jgi:hypothetical protein
MQDKSFNATTIVTPDTANGLALDAAFNSWAEDIKSAGILHVRFHHDMKAHDRAFQVVYVEPLDEYLAVDQEYMGWKLVTAWTGAIVGSWGLVIGCVTIARALLA